jgi:uncharacterized protein (TIGR03435 family)
MRYTAMLFVLVLGQAAPRPAFEVASIKPSNELEQNGDIRWLPGGTVRIRNLALRDLLLTAFGTRQRSLLRSQLIGVPDWATSDRYDITAKIGADLAARPQTEWFANLSSLLQSLLEDRFKLRTHREMRELPVFVVRMANDDRCLGRNCMNRRSTARRNEANASSISSLDMRLAVRRAPTR